MVPVTVPALVHCPCLSGRLGQCRHFSCCSQLSKALPCRRWLITEFRGVESYTLGQISQHVPGRQEALNVYSLYWGQDRHNAVGIDTMNKPRPCPFSQVELSQVSH